MGVSVDLYSYDYELLVNGIRDYVGASDTDVINGILALGGSVIGDKYILLNNELWDGCSPYYNVAQALENYYNAEDVFGKIFCTYGDKYGCSTLINACDSPEEMLDSLGLTNVNEQVGGLAERKDYILTYKQLFMENVLEDKILKFNKTVAEMDEAVEALFTDPHVFSADYVEVPKQ